MSNDKARGWSKERWDQWYASQRKTRTAKAGDEYWEQPPTLSDAVDVTAGSRLVANQLAAKLWREQHHLSFAECVGRVFDQHPQLYESEIALSQRTTKAHYDGQCLT